MVAPRVPLQKSVQSLELGWIAVPALIAAPATSCFRSQDTSCQFRWLGGVLVQITEAKRLAGSPASWERRAGRTPPKAGHGMRSRPPLIIDVNEA
jgi:hypothetical protein